MMSPSLVRDQSAPRTQGRRPARRVFAAVVGVLAAFAASEALLSLWMTPFRWTVPPLPISSDSAAAPYRVHRQFHEGISTASVNDSGARFTGPFLPGAPVVVILGDSHVLARNVSDGEAMGTVTERLARGAGYPLNVRELGRSGGMPADYAYLAPQVLATWHPSQVFIVVGPRAFVPAGLSTRLATLKEDSSGVRVIPVSWPKDSAPKRLYESFRRTSALSEMLVTRITAFYWMLRDQGGATEESEGPVSAGPDTSNALRRTVHIALTALQNSYGDRLVIVYHPNIGIEGGYEPDETELAVQSACAVQNISCFSVRPEMIVQRDRYHLLSNGFINTAPGIGHLNATGHRVVGTAIWAFLQKQAPLPGTPR